MKLMLRNILVCAVAGIMILPSVSQAGEIDVLVDKLVEKGVLSSVEAKIILDETKTEVAKQISEAKSSSIPDWVQRTKLKGDVRLRYQNERKSNDTDFRNRGRLRYRLGLESKINNQLKVGAGLASGSSDPRSTNQTFQDTFSTKAINLDYAYAEYTPLSNLKAIAGKFAFKSYLWAPTDMLWDGDINPEGASVNLTGSLADVNYWLNGGIWLLDENGTADRPDPFLKYVQGGLSYNEGILDSKIALTYYAPSAVKDINLDNDSGTNTSGSEGLRSNFHSIALGGEFGFSELFGGLPLSIDERIALFGEFIHNMDDENSSVTGTNGWAFGMKMGNKKVKEFGQWQLKYTKAVLERDAWIDAFPDSDRFGGKTNIASHEVGFEYGLSSNVTFGLDYYKSWSISAPNNKENLLQADLVLKF